MAHTPEHRPAILTIGHSNHSWEVFQGLLRRHGIEMVVDVRSTPASRWAPHFNKARIEGSLADLNISYLFLGDALGGRPKNKNLYDDQGKVVFSRIAETDLFIQGVDRLLAESSRCRLAIMCGEGDPKDCHRRLLVGKALEGQGVQVIHIMADGKAMPEVELAKEERAIRTEQEDQLELLGGDGSEKKKT